MLCPVSHLDGLFQGSISHHRIKAELLNMNLSSMDLTMPSRSSCAIGYASKSIIVERETGRLLGCSTSDTMRQQFILWIYRQNCSTILRKVVHKV